jgi:hypothetical protein
MFMETDCACVSMKLAILPLTACTRAGWIFRVPLLRRVVAFFFLMPGAVKIVTMLANRLPKRFVRGR